MAKECPKCRSSMGDGSVFHTDGGQRTLIRWLEGPTIKGLFGGIKLKGRKPVDIQSFRCRKCGFLELYAPD